MPWRARRSGPGQSPRFFFHLITRTMKRILALILVLAAVSLASAQAVYLNRYAAGAGYWMAQQSASQAGMLWFNTASASWYHSNGSAFVPLITNQTVSGDLSGTLPSPSVVAITNLAVGVDTLRAWNFTIPDNKAVFPVTTASRNVYATLPSAATHTGRILTVFARAGSDSLFLRDTGGATISGADTVLIGNAAYKSITVAATDSTWQIISTH